MSPSMENTPSVISSLWPLAPSSSFRISAARAGILVREDVNLGSRQPAAVDDAGVIQRVGNDVIFRRPESPTPFRHSRQSRIETRRTLRSS